MEDAVVVQPALIEESQLAANVYDFFDVYDGHGGDMVARACRERLHVALATEVEKRRWCSSMAVAVGEEEGWREATGRALRRWMRRFS
ncbi:Protein phosphatase 2C 16 [Acorus calamus]|uniref:protein-serine/threonine phosphatase n=1 Tax=Acorus calamus TaxID=4465 RepID=A0AAV9DND3_ACOCL|nr:Protein phosphatase 2C 16 [Acorus calamus]